MAPARRSQLPPPPEADIEPWPRGSAGKGGGDLGGFMSTQEFIPCLLYFSSLFAGVRFLRIIRKVIYKAALNTGSSLLFLAGLL